MMSEKWRQGKHGKVRDMLVNDEEGKVVLVATDRVSAFDRNIPTEIPDKGKILTEMSIRWAQMIDFASKLPPCFKVLSDDEWQKFDFFIETAYQEGSDYPERDLGRAWLLEPESFGSESFIGRSTMMAKLDMLPIECIVRGYLTGSGLKSYQKDGTVCGIKLPEGLVEASKLPEPIYTPTTKADIGHDEHITYEQSEMYIEEAFPDRGRELAEEAREWSLILYKAAAAHAEECGIIIADTKFEFGVDEDGELWLADEILTPDSSRFWDASKYEEGKVQESFDKQPLRDFLQAHPDYQTKELPWAVVDKTRRRYAKALKMLFDVEI